MRVEILDAYQSQDGKLTVCLERIIPSVETGYRKQFRVKTTEIQSGFKTLESAEKVFRQKLGRRKTYQDKTHK